jgi:glucuronate isomerase
MLNKEQQQEKYQQLREKKLKGETLSTNEERLFSVLALVFILKEEYADQTRDSQTS